jgi:hypothetical protein
MLPAVSEPAARPRLRNALVALALAASLCTGAVVWWRDGGKRLFQPRKWDEVDAGFLYRSGQIHRRLIEDTLREHGIDLVIDLAKDRNGDLDAAAEREAIRKLGIQRIEFDLNGSGQGNPSDYADALSAIAAAHVRGEQVLVHCNAGSERTGGVTMLYRTLFQGWSGADAYAEYASYRNRPAKDSKVAWFLDRHVGEIAQQLVAQGVLRAVPDPLPVYSPEVAAAHTP